MILTRKATRLALTALLVAPVIPLAILATNGTHFYGSSAACAAGASCVKCVLDNCGTLPSGWTLVPVGNVTLTRCIDYDKVAPGHCADIVFNQEDISDGTNVVATCMKSNCQSSTIYNSRACNDPLYL
jgi:hypothetical protein